ncbi:hypothetical protein VTI74DRAFT_5679 [Chaetomium olivicolor]
MTRVSPLFATLRRPTAQLIPRCPAATTSTSKPAGARAFSHLPTLRPSLAPSQSIFRAPSQTLQSNAPTTVTAGHATTTGETTLDLLSKSAITAHPALAGCASQIRCGPRPTMSNASRLIQKRRHGFLSRVKTQTGRKTLMRRRVKGRKRLSA